jgi:hypothetical protein
LAIFEFEEASTRGGKHEDRQTGVAEDEQFHVAVEAAGMPFVVFAIHGLRFLFWRPAIGDPRFS